MNVASGMVVDGSDEGGKKRGVKRQADESNLSDDQRFAKRFNLLSLGPNRNGNSYNYIPSQPRTTSTANGSQNESMAIDDTKHRVYIGDLDAEIADIEAHEPQERLIFLPDIEKHFSRIPQHVLTGGRASDAADQQLVLYDVPKSLTVDEEHDSVRKAILEARHRARDKAKDDARQEEMSRIYSSSPDDATEVAHGYVEGYAADDDGGEDEDAMDIS